MQRGTHPNSLAALNTNREDIWALPEVKRLEHDYSTKSIETITQEFPNRSLQSIYHKASRLGLKTAYRPVKSQNIRLSPIDIGYFAGIIDGEGTITITSWKRPDGRIKYNPRLEVHNTNTDLVAFLQRLLKIAFVENRGVRNYRRNEILKGENPKPNGSHYGKRTVYCVSMQGRKLVFFLQKLYPYLIVKQQNALLVLEWLKSREEHLVSPYTDREIEIVREIRRLNTK